MSTEDKTIRYNRNISADRGSRQTSNSDQGSAGTGQRSPSFGSTSGDYGMPPGDYGKYADDRGRFGKRGRERRSESGTAKMWLLLGSAGLGAGLMYIFDVEHGRRRRALLRDKIISTANELNDAAGSKSRHLGNQARGLIAEAKSRLTGGETFSEANELKAFKEGTVAFSEWEETPVIDKRAHVVEEVSLGKNVEERTEKVRGTVKRSRIEVDHAAYEADFRQNYQANFAAKGMSYEQYVPAYQYGYELANNERYKDRDWAEIESDARRNWESRNQGAWGDYREAARYAWERTRRASS